MNDQTSYEISQRFYFDAAHTLKRAIQNDSEAAASRRVHGHTYHAEVFLRGQPQGKSGMVMDLGFVRVEVEALREKLDHHFLDEVAGVGIPTLENLCAYIWRELKPKLPTLCAVCVERHSIGDKCTYRP